MIAVPLPDSDHVSRYCKPSAVDERGLPLTAAFLPKQGEEYLSVNWLEYFGALNLTLAVDQVRQVFRHKNYRVRPKGPGLRCSTLALRRLRFKKGRANLRVSTIYPLVMMRLTPASSDTTRTTWRSQ